MKRKLKARGFTFADRVYGNLQSGRMNERYFLYTLDRLSAETNEIYFHPALPRDEKLTDEQRQCAIEFEALTSAAVKKRISELGIKLSNYVEIEAAR